VGPEPGEAADVLREVGHAPVGAGRHARFGLGSPEGSGQRPRLRHNGVDVLGVVHRTDRRTDSSGEAEGHDRTRGFDPTGSLDVPAPVLVPLFAVGLSTDYEVFLLSRIKEVYARTGDNDTAVAVGLQRTGRIITSAALLIVVVFVGFATGG